jgi:hypothetical protein
MLLGNEQGIVEFQVQQWLRERATYLRYTLPVFFIIEKNIECREEKKGQLVIIHSVTDSL